MIIDEEKIRARSKLSASKMILPSLRFKKGDSKQQNAIEVLKLIIGITVVASVVFASCALIYTLVTEGTSATSALIEKKSKPAEKPQYMQVTFKPKNQQQK